MIDDKGGVCATCKHCIVKENFSGKAMMCECECKYIDSFTYYTYCCDKYEFNEEWSEDNGEN